MNCNKNWQVYLQDLTWGKVVSLYAVAGGLAVDCVRQGHYDYLTSIVEAMEEILEDELAHWIQDKGGWVSNSSKRKKKIFKSLKKFLEYAPAFYTNN